MIPPSRGRRHDVLAVALVVGAAAVVVAGDVLVHLPYLDLGFTTSNVVWLLATALPWAAALLTLGAATTRSRRVATAALASTGVLALVLAIIGVVQVVLGARPTFIGEVVLLLLTMALAAAAALLVRLRASDRLDVVALVLAIVVVVVVEARELRMVAGGLAGPSGIDALTLVAILLTSAVALAPAIAVGLLAARGAWARWTSAALLALWALQLVSWTIGAALGHPVEAITPVVALALVVAAIVALVRSALARRARAGSSHPVAAAVGTSPPPPTPGTQVPPPAQ